MRIRYTGIFSYLAIFVLVASLAALVNLPIPSLTAADSGICKWDYINTPGSFDLRNDIRLNSEINKLVVGPNNRLLAVVTRPGPPSLQFYSSGDIGRSWGGSTTLLEEMIKKWGAARNVWNVAIAPDDSRFWALVTSGQVTNAPVEVWVTEDGGSTWWLTNLVNVTGGGANSAYVAAITISPAYSGHRDIAVGIRNGGLGVNAPMEIWVLQSAGFSSWNLQTNLPLEITAINPADVIDLKFSPTYAGDSALGVVFSDADETFFNIALRDIDDNDIGSWAFSNSVEVKDPTSPAGASPGFNTIVTADLELPSDFSGQAASLQRAYVSVDALGAGVPGADEEGIYRIDNTTVYELLDTIGVGGRSISSIAYYGTYASGKLLAGDVFGYPCTATVPTWFTDSPTTCPIPCWYPALKPTTGAANQGTCASNSKNGQGNAQVVWNTIGSLALVGTGSSIRYAQGEAGHNWWDGFPVAPIPNDESAFAISRNNGETWNQLSLIDTTISWFSDLAISADCNTLYLASSSNSSVDLTGCASFDSVWRSSLNTLVEEPLRVVSPIGSYWERVLTRVTAPSCAGTQTDYALLRLVSYCADPSGEIVAWGVYDTDSTFTNGVAVWSPDYGDYWAEITVRDPIQDFTFESRTVMYFLSPDGRVHKMPYTGTAWGTTLPAVNTAAAPGHMIAAMPEGKVLVGYTIGTGAPFPATISFDGGTTFAPLMQPLPTGRNIHVAFDPDFNNNNMVYIGDDRDVTGHVYRANVANPFGLPKWQDSDLMSLTNNAEGCPDPEITNGIYGLAVAYTGGTLYAADGCGSPYGNSGVWRTLTPLVGIPKPGIYWDRLDVFTLDIAGDICFTLEPYSLKLCGCCTLDTNTTLYAIDARNYVPADREGMPWAFTDCMAKQGPALITEDKALIGCDPVSGRAAEVNLCWEQLCVAEGYDIEIGKDADFTIKVLDWVTEGACDGFLVPASITAPCAYVPAGGSFSIDAESDEPAMGSAVAFYGQLECGHVYYWRVKVRQCVTGEDIRSPWSEVRSFSVKAGLPVVSAYSGLQLLSPANGAMGVSISKPSFSWSPIGESTKYKFVLATDAAMTQVVSETEVASTSYAYDGNLEYNTNYFWRVMALEPAPSDWSATFSFRTGVVSSLSTDEVPSRVGFWDVLTVPARAVIKWMATITPQSVPAGPMPLWVPVGIGIGIVLLVVWLVVMVAISRRRPHVNKR